jgi:nucleoside-diphosphate-sugar epimerase
MRILIIGATSFVAKGVVGRLSEAGHDVFCHQRGPIGFKDGVVFGRLDLLDEAAALVGPVDVVVNYAILKNADIEANEVAIDGIIRFCKASSVKRLLHFSSISVYGTNIVEADETSQLPADPLSKGAYASLKVAADRRLLEQTIYPELTLAFIRPGFVLGPGLLNPFPGMGFRLPINRLLVFGGGTASVPLVSRSYVHEMVLRITELPDLQDKEVFHCFDPNAPDRRTFLQTCNEVLGLSSGVWRLPAWFWLTAGFCFDILLRLIGRSPLFVRSLKNASSKQTFSAAHTEQRFGMCEKVDMASIIRESFTLQSANYQLAQLPSVGNIAEPAGGVSVIGAGRIVETAHIEAYKRLGWDASEVSYYDLASRDASFGQVRSLQDVSLSGDGLWVVATPATVHIHAVDTLKSCNGRCLLEKPLALNRNEWSKWKTVEERGMAVGVCHNYRFKDNVRQMREFIEAHPTGELLSVNLLFQSPPVRSDASPWIREERVSKSLLMDYSIHFLDLACLFQAGSWRVDALDWLLDQNGDTEVIRGRCSNERYPLTFHLQQGFCTRACRIEYVFRNYTAVLSFFPDTFYVRMSPDGAGIATIAAINAWKGTLRKIFEKLSKRTADGSHAYCYADLLANGGSAEIAMSQLENYYELLFELSERVYG